MTAPLDRYERRARCTRVVDGDTQDMIFDLGFSFTHTNRVRLLGVNTPESRTLDLDEKARGVAATEYVREWMAEAAAQAVDPVWPLVVRTRITGARGKYGRMFVTRVWRGDGHELGRDLLEHGHAVVYLP